MFLVYANTFEREDPVISRLTQLKRVTGRFRPPLALAGLPLQVGGMARIGPPFLALQAESTFSGGQIGI